MTEPPARDDDYSPEAMNRDDVQGALELLEVLAPKLADIADDPETTPAEHEVIGRVASTLRELGADRLADELEAGRYRPAARCGRPNPFPDLPACQRKPGHEGDHRAVWNELGGQSTLTWTDGETIREQLRPQREEAREAQERQEGPPTAE